MDYLLSKVDDVFALKGRGVVVAPGIPGESDESVKVLVGDGLRLKRPDGSVVETMVRGIEMGGGGGFIPLLLGEDVEKSDVPIGTEVWVVPQAR